MTVHGGAIATKTDPQFARCFRPPYPETIEALRISTGCINPARISGAGKRRFDRQSFVVDPKAEIE